MPRTPEDIKAEFRRKGISVSAWAVANGVTPNIVYDLLAGRRNPTRGQTHNIAVKLGLKQGEIVDERHLADAIGS